MSNFATLFITAMVPLIAGACTAIDGDARFTTTARLGDAAYCQALAERYMTHVGIADGLEGRNLEGGPRTALDPDVAIAQCQGGNPGLVIAALEQKLSDSGVELPPRFIHVGHHPFRP